MSSAGSSGKNIEINKTAFGETQVAQLTGKVFAQFAYNINAELFTDNSSAAGSISVADSFCVLSSGAAIASSGKISSIPVIEYQPGTGGVIRFTAVYGAPVAGNIQFIGIGNDNDGFFIGYNGTNFSISRRKNSVDNITIQADFSEDKLDGTGPSGMIIDTTKGNVFQIQYQWLGFGEIRFYVENPNTGDLFIFHRIKYANQNVLVSVSNPTLSFQAESTNTTNDTDVLLKTASAGVYSEGTDSPAMHLVHGANNTKDGITAEAAVISIRNNATYAAQTNLIRVQPKIISVASEGNRPVLVSVYKNTALGGAPAFNDFNSNTSPVSIDVAGTTITGGIKILSFALGKSDNSIVYLDDLPIILAPGDIFTIAASSALATEIAAGITWDERFS